MNKIHIAMRIKLGTESLNNEESIGNITMPRVYRWWDDTTRDGISGDMLKHFHARNLRLLADDDEVCSSCRVFSPMRDGKVKEVDEKLSASGNRVKACIIDDVEGFANLDNKKPPLATRSTCINFTNAVSMEESEYQTVIHNRVDVGTMEKKAKKAKGDAKDATIQAIIHKPVRSNEYSLGITVQLDRIGLDDEKLVYTLPDEEIIKRQKKCLQAIKFMFLDMEGALCATQMPHVGDIEGMISIKKDRNDTLIKYSSTQSDYREVIQEISTHSIVFANIREFNKVMNELIG